MKKPSLTTSLLMSGLVFSAINFLTGLGNLAFQAVIGHHLPAGGQFGDANGAITGFLPLLLLLPAAATFAVTHYIAHFNNIGDHDRLQGLFLGCRRFLFWLTVGGSVLVLVVIKPLGNYFNYDQGVMLATLVCSLLGLWGAFVTALCQGLGWFKRLALIGFLTMVLRFLFGWLVVLHWTTAECAVLATAFSYLANLVLVIWRKDLALKGSPVSPLNREFIHYLIVSTAFVVGSYCFLQGDLLVAKKFFLKQENDAYACAKLLAIALPTTVAPLLTVLFTARSGSRSSDTFWPQMRLLGVYVVGLLVGAGLLYGLRTFCVHMMVGKNAVYGPDAARMIGPLALTMVAVGLLQALAQWSLASRWSRSTLLFCGLGVTYWILLLGCGQTGGTDQSADRMLHLMPIASGASLAILFFFWIIRMRRQHQAQS